MSRDLILMALALVTWGVGEGMFYFFQPLYLQELGADPVKIGAILGVVGISMGVAHLPAGYLSDRFGRRPLLIIAWLSGLVATAIMALSTNLTFFVIGMSIYGVTAFVGGPMNAYVTAARGNWSVPRALTLISASFNTGAILGPLLGGWVGEHFGLRSSFGFSLIPIIISCGLIFFIRPQPIESGHHDTPGNTLGKMLNPAFVRFLVLAFGVYFFIYLPQPLAQNFLVNERHLNLANIGLLLSSRSLGVVILSLLAGFLDANLGLAATQIGVVLFSLIIWQANALPAFMLGYALMGSTNPARIMLTAQARALSKAENMGLAYGMLETVLSVVLIAAPPLAGALYVIQPDLVFPICAAGILITIVLGWFFMPRGSTPAQAEAAPPV